MVLKIVFYAALILNGVSFVGNLYIWLAQGGRWTIFTSIVSGVIFFIMFWEFLRKIGF